MAKAQQGSKRGTKAEAKATPDGSAQDDRALVCNVAFCPICMAVTAAEGAAPDVLEHLLAAAREFFLAARAIVDSRGDHLSGGDANPNGSRDFEKIEIS